MAPEGPISRHERLFREATEVLGALRGAVQRLDDPELLALTARLYGPTLRASAQRILSRLGEVEGSILREDEPCT
jgi:hypothetical protein